MEGPSRDATVGEFPKNTFTARKLTVFRARVFFYFERFLVFATLLLFFAAVDLRGRGAGVPIICLMATGSPILAGEVEAD